MLDEDNQPWAKSCSTSNDQNELNELQFVSAITININTTLLQFMWK